MAWLVHYYDDMEAVFQFKPERSTDLLDRPSWSIVSGSFVFLEHPISRRILGYEMTYEDNPVEI